MRQLETQADAQELVDYNPFTGVLIWKERDLSWFDPNPKKGTPEKYQKRFNTLFAGKEVRSKNEKGRHMVKVNSTSLYVGRFIWLYVHGYLPEDGMEIDHIDRDLNNNKLINLREIPKALNLANRGPRKTNKLGYAGVKEAGNRFTAEYRGKYLGTFDTALEASLCREAAVRSFINDQLTSPTE